MKQAEAIELIKKMIGEEKNKEEILDTILTYDKIGTSKPTEEIAEELYKKALEDKNQTNTNVMKQAEGCNYEKWEVEIDRGKFAGKLKKLKDVRLTEDQANLLNAAKMSGSAKGIMYIKKQ